MMNIPICIGIFIIISVRLFHMYVCMYVCVYVCIKTFVSVCKYEASMCGYMNI